VPFTVTICSDRLVHMRQYSSVDRAVKRSSACATESLDRIFDAVTPVEVDVEFDGRRRLEHIADIDAPAESFTHSPAAARTRIACANDFGALCAATPPANKRATTYAAARGTVTPE